MLNLLCGVLILYFSVIVFDIVFYSVKCLNKKKNINTMAVSMSTHYLCAVLSAMVDIALYLNIKDFDEADVWFYIIFGVAVMISIPLMLWAVLWKVEWTDKKLYYRNFLGQKKQYRIEEVYLLSKPRSTYIMYRDKKITDYSEMLYSFIDICSFENFIKVNSKKK